MATLTATMRRYSGLSIWPESVRGTIFPLLLTLLVLGLVAAPIVVLVVASFRPAGELPFTGQVWTTATYGEVFANAGTYKLLRNTLLYAAGTMAVALPLAFMLAWLTERTDLPGRHLLYTLMFVPMLLPPFAIALGWILLSGPNAGTLNVFLRQLFALRTMRGPLNIYSIWGMVFVSGVLAVPSMWLLLLGLFRNFDARLEEAAAASGASRWQVLKRVTVPLMLPGILAVVVYFSIIFIEAFEVPLAIGTTAEIPVLSTKIYLLTSRAEEGYHYGAAATFGLMTLLAGVLLMLGYLWAVRVSARFAVVTGKGYRPRLVRLGHYKYVALGGVIGYFTVAVILPTLILVWASLLRYYVPFSLDNLHLVSLQNYRLIFGRDDFLLALKNTFITACITATASMLLAALLAWYLVRRASLLAGVLGVLSFMPLAIPNVIIALAMLLLYTSTPLHGTLLILILAFVTRYLAFTTRVMHAAQLQIDKVLEEAALVAGAGRLGTFVKITLRVLMPALLNGWLWVVAHVVRDFAIPLFLATSSTLLIANLIWGQWELGSMPMASAYMVVLIALVVVLVCVGRGRLGAAQDG
ncbi:MAG TPA: ABC transporter permease subunit [Candidatus Tectomicrobia bacterium]|jgi:iron(III) transport system permease protein